jgi:hypothetical protein
MITLTDELIAAKLKHAQVSIIVSFYYNKETGICAIIHDRNNHDPGIWILIFFFLPHSIFSCSKS